MRRWDRIVAGVVVATPRGSAPVDPLAALSDDFSTDTGEWSDYKVSSSAGDTVADGYYQQEILAGGGSTAGTGATSFWFDTTDGRLRYKEVSGDCEMRARIEVWNATFDGLPTASSYRIAGIAIHDPDRSSVYNYVHIGGGTVAGVYSVETKTTTNSDSLFPADAVATATPWLMDIMIRRVGTGVTTRYRVAPGVELSSDTGWTQHQSYTRADLPALCQWGMMVYSNAVGHDIAQRVHEVQFRTPGFGS